MVSLTTSLSSEDRGSKIQDLVKLRLVHASQSYKFKIAVASKGTRRKSNEGLITRRFLTQEMGPD